MFSSKKREKEKKRKNKNKKRKTMTSGNIFSIENQMQVMPLARNPKEKTEKKRKTRKKRKNNRKIKKPGKTEMLCFLKPFLDHFLPPDGFVSIQIQMVVWHVNNLDCWPLFISPLGFLLYPRHAIHVLEYGSEKSSIYSGSHFDMFSR